MKISFIEIDVTLEPKQKTIATKAIKTVLPTQNGEINIVACSDEYILSKNKEVLKHNYYTDIITFYYNPEKPTEEVELLISLERIKENSEINKVELNYEFARVVIHGCLHLIGYDDKTEDDKNKMREKEDYYLKRVFHVEQ